MGLRTLEEAGDMALAGYVVLFRDKDGTLQLGTEDLLSRREAHEAARDWSKTMPWPEIVAKVTTVAIYDKGTLQ